MSFNEAPWSGRFPRFQMSDRELVLLNPGIFRSIQNRSAVGQPVDYVTPIVDRSNKVQSRKALVEELHSNIITGKYPWLDDIELEQAAKVGPYSIMLPFEQRVEGVLAYFGPKRVNYDSQILAQAWKRVSELLQPKSLDLMDVHSAFNEMPKNTNLGLPWLTSKSDVDRYHVLDMAKYMLDDIHSGVAGIDSLSPAILFWRGQPRGLEEYPKQRVVWGFPHDITLLEIMAQTPLLDALVTQSTFAAWVSQDRVNDVATMMLLTNKFPLLSIDFSGFDASVPGLLIKLAFDLLRLWFKDQYRNHIDFLEYVFANIPLSTPNGVLPRVDGSVPSGSGLTNMIDSLVQLISVVYAAIKSDTFIALSMVQGDDGVYSFGRPWNPETIYEALSELGLHASSDKGGVSMDSIRFLQNVHYRTYVVSGRNVGIRPLSRILNGMMSYERMHTSWNMFLDTIRWYQQIESGRFHPYFNSLVKLLYNHDKVSRLFGVREIVSRAGGLEAAKSVLREKSFPYGKYGLSGLSGFKTVEILNALKNT